MKRFQGFPSRMEFTSIPNAFFSSLLPQIDDMAELKTTLHVLALLYRRKGYPRFVSYTELASDTSLISSLKCGEEPAGEALRGALKAAAERGTLLQVSMEKDGGAEEIYFLNDEPGRQAAGEGGRRERGPAVFCNCCNV